MVEAIESVTPSPLDGTNSSASGTNTPTPTTNQDLGSVYVSSMEQLRQLRPDIYEMFNRAFMENTHRQMQRQNDRLIERMKEQRYSG